MLLLPPASARRAGAAGFPDRPVRIVLGFPPGSGPDLLARLLAAAPLAQWPRLLGADPATLAGLPVDGGFAVEVHAGWRAAAVRQADPEWARALLAAGPAPDQTKRPVEAWTTDAELAAVLPLPDRLDRVLALLRADPLPQTAVAEVSRLPAPWPEVLARAVVAHLSRVSRSGRRSPADSLLLDAAARRLPASREPDWVGELTVIAGLAMPESWSARVLWASETLGVRRHFEEKIR
jgi:hypothetical protein